MDRSLGQRRCFGGYPRFLFPVLLFLFLFSAFLPSREIRAEKVDMKENPLGLTEEERQKAEQLPAIDSGKAAEQFAKFGFPRDGSTYDIACWIARNGLAVSRIPLDDAETADCDISVADIDLLADLCDQILALDPPRKFFTRIFWFRHLMRQFRIDNEKPSVESTVKALTFCRDDLLLIIGFEDYGSTVYKNLLVQQGVSGIGNAKMLFGEIPPQAAEIGKEFLAAADTLLADQPLERPYEILYESRVDLLRLLAETDPAYAPVLDQRQEEILELLKTRGEEILATSLYGHMFAAAVPDPPLTEKKIETARVLLELFDRLDSQNPVPENWEYMNAASSVDKITSLLDGAGIDLDPAPAEIPVETGKFPAGTAAGEKRALTANGVTYVFAWCPPGEFTMGSPESEEGHTGSEKEHRVALTQGFWMLESEITVKMWDSVMGKGGRAVIREKENPLSPASYVTGGAALEFCEKLSRLSGNEITLPTEAQWEYACRAGSNTPYAGAGSLDDVCWYRENGRNRPHRGKRKAPNAWGLYDMLGNLDEWCRDGYDEAFYSHSPEADPCAPLAGRFRVRRGGNWCSYAEECRAASRAWHRFATGYTGFRIILVPEAE